MDAVSLQQANEMRIDLQLPAVTLSQVWLHFGHRLGAVLVTILISWLIVKLLREETNPGLRRPAWLLIGLLITQLTLGVLTVLWQKPADVASLHVLVGAITLMTTFTVIVRSLRLYPIRRTEVAHGHEELLVPA
jgi:cytochrome c oxidase assembly protein subunit 15